MKTVLIVDDSKLYRTAIAQLFTKLGWSTYQADDGLEGKSIMETHPIDLVLLDIVMPKLDGYALCRWIKDNPKTKLIPVIICSSKKEITDKYWGIKQGADCYLTKPIDAKRILKAVGNIFKDQPIQFSLSKGIAQSRS